MYHDPNPQFAAFLEVVKPEPPVKPPEPPMDKLRDWVQKAEPVMKIIGWARTIWDILQSLFGRKCLPAAAAQV